VDRTASKYKSASRFGYLAKPAQVRVSVANISLVVYICTLEPSPAAEDFDIEENGAGIVKMHSLQDD